MKEQENILKLKKYIKHKINQHILLMFSNHPTKAIQNIYIYFKEETGIGTSKTLVLDN